MRVPLSRPALAAFAHNLGSFERTLGEVERFFRATLPLVPIEPGPVKPGSAPSPRSARRKTPTSLASSRWYGRYTGLGGWRARGRVAPDHGWVHPRTPETALAAASRRERLRSSPCCRWWWPAAGRRTRRRPSRRLERRTSAPRRRPDPSSQRPAWRRSVPRSLRIPRCGGSSAGPQDPWRILAPLPIGITTSCPRTARAPGGSSACWREGGSLRSPGARGATTRAAGSDPICCSGTPTPTTRSSS